MGQIACKIRTLEAEMPSVEERWGDIDWSRMYDPSKVTEIVSSKTINNWAKIHPLTIIPNRID